MLVEFLKCRKKKRTDNQRPSLLERFSIRVESERVRAKRPVKKFGSGSITAARQTRACKRQTVEYLVKNCPTKTSQERRKNNFRLWFGGDGLILGQMPPPPRLAFQTICVDVMLYLLYANMIDRWTFIV